MKRDLYAEVSMRIVAELEAGAAPWVKPWSATPGANPQISPPLLDFRQLQRMKALRLTRIARPQTEALFALPDQVAKIIRNTFPEPV
jgi:N-terminal domain of anti-restriction factor ArdC